MHGNPHLDNYAWTPTGYGFLDFDRARKGPYFWDLLRFMGSLRLWSKDFDPKNFYFLKIIISKPLVIKIFMFHLLFFLRESFFKLLTEAYQNNEKINPKWNKKLTKKGSQTTKSARKSFGVYLKSQKKDF